MGRKVVDLQGQRIELRQAIARVVVKDLPFVLLNLSGVQALTFLWLIAHLVVIHRSPVSQAIHDRLAGTIVAAPEQTTQFRIS